MQHQNLLWNLEAPALISRNLVVLASLFIFSACSSSSGGGDSTPPDRPATNLAPVVDAGLDATIRLPADTVALDGDVSDDGLPSGATVSTSWSVQSGPGGAVFSDVNSVDTSVTFVTEGVYILELTADDTSLQGSDTVTITVEAAPSVAVITVTPSDVSLLTGASQSFTASGTDQYGDPITPNVTWSATGGAIDQSGDYVAGNTVGSYEVTATDGAVSGAANVTISDSPPTAVAGGPYVGAEGSAVALDGSGSSDPNNDIVAYDWDLDNDGSFDDASGANATYAAGASGVYTIGLRVTDSDGATDSDTTTVTISNIAPTANAGGPYSGDEGADITVDGSASADPGNDIVLYEWDLDNDGAYDDATGVTATFNSTASGDFTIGLRVTDDDGDTGSATAAVSVANVAPTADAGGPYSGDQGEDIAVDGSASSDPGNDIVLYEWDLDNDGAYDDATGVTATFNSADSGDFTIGLRVTDSDGDTSTATAAVSVSNVAPTADAGGPYSGDQGTDIAVDGSGSSDPGNDIVSYEWDLDNDGAYDDATGVTATFNSADSGDFTIGLRVTDVDGDSGTNTATVNVIDTVPPEAPTGLSASGEDGQVVLDWDDNIEPDLDSYTVKRSTTQGGPYTVVAVEASSGSVDSTVTNGTTYYYVVTAEDVTGNPSADSAEVTVTPNAAVDAFWRMDEGADLTAADTGVPGDIDGTLSSATMWTTDAISGGQALDFDGDDSVVIDNDPLLHITGKTISMHAWLFPRSGGGESGSRIISKRYDAGGDEVFAMVLENYRLHFRINGFDLVSSHIVVLNEWVHVGMTYDGTRMRTYINGTLDAIRSEFDPIDASSRAVHLGVREGEGLFFDGIMDDVRILNTVLKPPSVVPPPRGAGLFFEDITEDAGTSGPVDGGHGVMFAEVDDDSLPDYYLTNNLENNADRPDFYFDNTDGASFTDLAAALGIQDTDGGSHGAVWADLDNDGDYDLVNGTTWDNSNPSRGNPDNDNVFENRLNEVSSDFNEITPATIQAVEIETRGITAFDWDADGDLDLFGVPGGTPEDSIAFENELDTGGAFSFNAISGSVLTTAAAMQGLTDTDFDGDGDIDVLAANRNGDFAILANDGNGVFTQIPPAELNITDSAGDGLTTADVDNDGDLDLLLVSDGTGNLWLRDQPTGNYVKQQSFESIEGYMGGFADLDNDGDQDLVFAGDERVYLNDGSGIFVSDQSVPVPKIRDPRAIAFADIDSDGDLDFAIAAKLSRNWLVKNELDPPVVPDDVTNWLRVELVSPQCQAGAFGAKVWVRPAGDAVSLVGMREAKGNYGYLGQDDPVLHFGLGTVSSVDVFVDWLDGTTASSLGEAANQRILIDACPPP